MTTSPSPSSCLLLLFLLAAAATCAVFALESSAWLGTPPPPAAGDAAARRPLFHHYGDGQPPIPPAAPVRTDAWIDGSNVAEAIFDEENRRGAALNLAADGAEGDAPTDGLPDADEAVQARLRQQEQYEPPQSGARDADRGHAQRVAQRVLSASIAAAEPAPPKLRPLDDLLPSRVWQPVYSGCAPFFVESECQFYKPNPRLNVVDLNELLYARNLASGQTNLVEPLRARQGLMQMLAMDVRSKKDPYSRASLTNSVALGTCRALEKATPDFVKF